MSPKTLPFFLLSLLLFSCMSTSNASQSRGSHSYSPTPYVTPHLPPARPTSDIYLYMKAQNAARTAVGVPPLLWDERLAGYARWWANQRRSDCALRHSSGPYGENIFWGSGDSWSPAFAVQSWIVEEKWYNYHANSCDYGRECGHYTQVVWKDSRRVGCAKVVCYNGLGVFITCNYDPPGNYIGSRPY